MSLSVKVVAFIVCAALSLSTPLSAKDGNNVVSHGYGESSIDAVMAIGDVYFEHGKLKEAEQAYRQCNEKDPKLVRAYLQLFKVCLASGRSDDEAMSLFKTCMETTNPLAEECMAFTGPCARRKRPELAELIVRETSKRFPQHSSIKMWEIHQLIKRKNVRQAWLILREQLKVMPCDRDASGLLMTCYYTLHDCDIISPYNDSILHEMGNSWTAVHACLECARVRDKKADLEKGFAVLARMAPEMTNAGEVADVRQWCWKRHYYEQDLLALHRLLELRKGKLAASEFLSMKLEICQCLLYLRRTPECIKETTGLLAAVEKTGQPLELARVCLVLAEAYANDGQKERATTFLDRALPEKRNFSTAEQAAVSRVKRSVM